MKKIFLVLLFPLLMVAMCCKINDCGNNCSNTYSSRCFIKNETDIDLVFLTGIYHLVIETQSKKPLTSISDTNGLYKPSEMLNSLKLYKYNDEGGLVPVYSQKPIIDGLWKFNEFSETKGYYTLSVTNAMLNIK